MSAKLSIVIPAYNEGKTIHRILDKVRDVVLISEVEKEVIIVNDCSTDNTAEAVENYRRNNSQLNIQFFAQPVNMGKGAALHRGIKEATGDFIEACFRWFCRCCVWLALCRRAPTPHTFLLAYHR